MSGPMYPQPVGLSHVAVVVRDLVASERFYLEILGLPLIRRHDDDRGRHRATWVALDASNPSGSFLAIERGEPDGVEPRDEDPGLHCLAIGIRAEDRTAWIERLAARGMNVIRSTRFTIYVRDPDGVLIGLSHFPSAIDVS